MTLTLVCYTFLICGHLQMNVMLWDSMGSIKYFTYIYLLVKTTKETKLNCVVQKCYVNQVFLKILQNLLKNICAGVPF